MKTIILASGTYAVDDLLADFEVIEKPSSNVAFVATNIATRQLYVQFKNGSGYMYSDVDLDTLSFIPVAESIGKFISSQVVKKFPSEKLDQSLIESVPVLIITGDIKNFPAKLEPGIIFQMSEGASLKYIEPINTDQEPEF
jgi:hypothetical protein